MAAGEALHELVLDWGELSAHLEPGRRLALRRALAAAVHGQPWTPEDVLQLAVGDRPEHPAWFALKSQTRRQSSGGRYAEQEALELRWLLEHDQPSDANAAVESIDALEQDAARRVLVAPMVAWPEDPDGDLVVLESGGRHLIPRFQYDDKGRPLAVVVTVNQLLGAAGDPWGVASWWLAPHAALHAIPADAVRHGRQSDVLAAAQAAVSAT